MSSSLSIYSRVTEPLKVRGLATFDRLDNAKLKRSKKTTGAHSKLKTKTNGVKEKRKNHRIILMITWFDIYLGLQHIKSPDRMTSVASLLAL